MSAAGVAKTDLLETPRHYRLRAFCKRDVATFIAVRCLAGLCVLCHGHLLRELIGVSEVTRQSWTDKLIRPLLGMKAASETLGPTRAGVPGRRRLAIRPSGYDHHLFPSTTSTVVPASPVVITTESF